MEHDDCRVPECHCPVCDKKIDAASNLYDESERPFPGDVSVCIQCGTILVFDFDLTMRLPTEEETRAIRENEELSKALTKTQVEISMFHMGLLDKQ